MSKIKYFYLLFILLSLQVKGEVFCEHPDNSQQIFECSKYNLEKSDEVLNLKYKELREYLKKIYSSNSVLSKKVVADLKKAQLSWLSYRNTKCDMEAITIESGTQAYETTVNNCLYKENKERVNYFDYLKSSAF